MSKLSDELEDKAIRIILKEGRGSVSLLQRRLNIDYKTASGIIEKLMIKRNPKTHLAIIPVKVRKEWQRKFGTKEKPHYKKNCKICGKSFGEHFGTKCPSE